MVSQDRLTPAEQLARVNASAAILMAEQQRQWRDLRGELRTAGLHLIHTGDVTATEHAWLAELFQNQLFPVLTPLAITDPAHPFLFIPNLAFSLVLKLKRRVRWTTALRAGARCPPRSRGALGAAADHQWPRQALRCGGSSRCGNMLALFLDHLFPGYAGRKPAAYSASIRDSELEIEEEAEDLVRPSTRCGCFSGGWAPWSVRVELESHMPEELRGFIVGSLHAEPQDVMLIDGVLGLDELSQLIPADRQDSEVLAVRAPLFPERIRDHGGDCLRRDP